MSDEKKVPEEFNLEQMEQETEEMLRLRYLTQENAEFTATPGGFVSLRVGEEFYPRVQIFRSFPFTDPEIYISIRQTDEKAKEIGMIRDLKKDVSPETAELLRAQMNLRYFTPQILKIYNIKNEYGYAYFDVKTDHGRCKFTMYMSSNSVVHLSDTRLLLSDLDGNRFEVRDINRLTTKELKKLDLFI